MHVQSRAEATLVNFTACYGKCLKSSAVFYYCITLSVLFVVVLYYGKLVLVDIEM